MNRYAERYAGISRRFASHQLPCDPEQLRSRRGRCFEQLIRLLERSPIFIRGGHLVPHLAGRFAQLGIILDGLPDLRVEDSLARNQPVVPQADEFAGRGLIALEKAGQDRLRGPPIALAVGRECGQLLDARPPARQRDRQRGIAVEGQLRGRGSAHGRGRIASRKHQIAVFGSRRAPLQKLGRRSRLAVLVDAQKRNIQPVPQIRHAVPFSAEKGQRIFGSKHQAYVGVLPILIEIVAAAGKQRYHRTRVCGLGRALAFDARDPGVARLQRLGGRSALLCRRFHLPGHVVDFHQDARRHAGAARFASLRSGVEGFRPGNAARHDVPVGDQQPARRYEGARAATDPHGRQAQMVQELAGGLEAVLLLDGLFGKLFEQPHTLVGGQRQPAHPKQQHGTTDRHRCAQIRTSLFIRVYLWFHGLFSWPRLPHML